MEETDNQGGRPPTLRADRTADLVVLPACRDLLRRPASQPADRVQRTGARRFELINRFLSFHNRQQKKFTDRAPELEDVFIIYPFNKKIEPETLRENEFIGVGKQDLNQIVFYAPYKMHTNKFVILHPVTFANKIDFNIHRLLRAIDNNMLLSKLPEHFQASPDEIMMPEKEMKAYFSQFQN